MDKQMSLSGLSDELHEVWTKKKEFLEKIERIVPIREWVALIQPQNHQKCVYSVLGINLDRRKEILGIWLSENESASLWDVKKELCKCRFHAK